MEYMDDPIISGELDTLRGRYLTFQIGEETYGIEIRYVTEIVGIQEITEMPETPDYIKGIINLRGRIIPVMDVRLRFGKAHRDYDDRTCVIVIDYGGQAVGFIVDSVAEVLAVDDGDISDRPGIGSGGNGFVDKIGKAGGSVILLVNCLRLLTDQVGVIHSANDELGE